MVTFAGSSYAAPPHLFFGRYRLLDEIGKGGFSSIFRVEDTFDHNQVVAVKQLRHSGLPIRVRGTARQSYRREVVMLTHLCHTRIPRLRDHSTSGSSWYLVLDYIAGETLEGYLKRQKALLPVDEVLDIGIQLCEVLEYLHGQHPPIKFRDLKPANIMRQPNGQLMLIDFGLALPFRPGRLDAVTLGTPGYAAPEQYANRYGQGATTLQSDIYSLGVILHQLLSGEHPAKKPLSALFVFSSLANKTLPELAHLVGEMLQREPGQRTRSIQEVKHLLQEVQATSFSGAEQKGVVIPITA